MIYLIFEAVSVFLVSTIAGLGFGIGYQYAKKIVK